jgi:hypothetical protein
VEEATFVSCTDVQQHSRGWVRLYLARFMNSDLGTSAMTWGSTLVAPQAIEWHTSIEHSATSLNYGILLQGFGGIIAVPFIDAYGR